MIIRKRDEEDGGGRKRGEMVEARDGKRQVRSLQQGKPEIVLGKTPHLDGRHGPAASSPGPVGPGLC